MSGNLDVFPSIYHLDDRDKAAEAVIRTYAAQHATFDIITGAAGGIIPFGSLPALAAQLYVQTQHIYPPMIRKLSIIYGGRA